MNYRKKKKNNMILLLLVLLGSLGIGYALLTQELTINGTGKVNANTWDIHFENLVPNQNNVTLSTGDVAVTIDSTTETDITYTVTLQKPGDFYEFTVDVVNEGSIDGMVGTVTSKLNNVVIDNEHPLPAYLNYSVTYSDGREILPNHLLVVNGTETYKVRLEYKLDIEVTDLQTTAQTHTLNFEVSYVQADSTAVKRPITRYTVNKPDSSVSGYNYVSLNQAVPNGITLYQTQQEALAAIKTASTKDLPFYLKHTIANDIVTESYVEILIDNTAKQYIINSTCNGNSSCEEYYSSLFNAIPNGTYTLRGGDSGATYTANKAVIESIFGTGCATEVNPGTSNASLTCRAGSFSVDARADGRVSADVASDYCNVISAGNSYCFWQ